MGKTKKNEEKDGNDGNAQTKVVNKKQAIRCLLYRQNENTERQSLEYRAVDLDGKVDALNEEISDLGGNDDQLKALAFKRTFVSDENLAKKLVTKKSRVKWDGTDRHNAKIEKDRRRRKFHKALVPNLREYVAEQEAIVEHLTSERDKLKLKNETHHNAAEEIRMVEIYSINNTLVLAGKLELEDATWYFWR